MKFFLIPFLYLIAFSVAAQKYTLKDLEVLVQQKSYREFLDHARDVRPSQRNKYWKDMVHKMAIGLVDQKISTKTINEKTFLQIENLSSWPSLRNDEFFQIKRSKFAKSFLTLCFEKAASNCSTHLYSFWHSSNKNADTAYTFLKLLSKKGQTKNTWNLYKEITLSNVSEFYCNRKIVKEAAVGKLYKDLNGNDSDANIIKVLPQIMNEKCFQQITKSLEEQLFLDNKILANLAFSVLSAKNVLSKKNEDLFLTHFILSGPIIGDTFNKAWNNLASLGQNFERRMQVLLGLKNMDPLPGKVFSTHDQSKRKTIIRYFHTHFPEYIDHYAKTCVNYLKGKGDFPTGNPTMECKQLFQITQGTKWVEQNLHYEYSSILKTNK